MSQRSRSASTAWKRPIGALTVSFVGPVFPGQMRGAQNIVACVPTVGGKTFSAGGKQFVRSERRAWPSPSDAELTGAELTVAQTARCIVNRYAEKPLIYGLGGVFQVRFFAVNDHRLLQHSHVVSALHTFGLSPGQNQRFDLL